MLTFMLTHFKNGHNARVIQVSRGLGLLVETLHVLFASQPSSENHLYGNDSIEARLLGAVNHSHAASCDLFN